MTTQRFRYWINAPWPLIFPCCDKFDVFGNICGSSMPSMSSCETEPKIQFIFFSSRIFLDSLSSTQKLLTYFSLETFKTSVRSRLALHVGILKTDDPEVFVSWNAPSNSRNLLSLCYILYTTLEIFCVSEGYGVLNPLPFTENITRVDINVELSQKI